MYLKRLEMQGFKSFADKISLDFCEGITAIVGPNGSGKSNITDAIRWVLGEQSAKSLRGSKMEDVIFAGTAKRKPTGFAQVSLILDKSEKMFPIDYEEINVTRRVYRSGESEYFINKAACRLRDIHELFMDTGLGRDGYSIIGQGRIDEILSNKSEDRRQIFEEAAGISKYKSKKTEAERKLASTEDNLARIKDIANELEVRLVPLEKQSQRAQKYLKLYEDSKGLDITICADTLEKLQKEENEIVQKLQTTAEDSQREEERLTALQEQEKEMYGSMRKTDADIELVKEEIHKIEIINTRAEGEISLLENNIASLTEEIERSEAEIEGTKAEIAENDVKANEIVSQTAALEEKRKAQLEIIDEKNAKVIELGEETDKKNDLLSALMEEKANLNNEKEEIKGRINAIEAVGSNSATRRTAVLQEIKDAEGEIAESEEKTKNYSKEITALREAVQNLQKEHAEKLAKAKKLQDETNALKDVFNQKNSDYNRASSRLSVLRDMEKNMEGYGAGQKALLSGRFGGDFVIHGVVSKLIRLDDMYSTAVEAAVGNGLQNIVVETDADAKKAIDCLKRNNLGRVTFLPVQSVSGKKYDFSSDFSHFQGFLGTLSDKVECDGKFRSIVDFLMGRTALFDNGENALYAAKRTGYKFRITTLDGEVLNPGGSITGGSLAKGGRFLQRGKEINLLEEACRDLQKQMDKTENTIDKNTEALYKWRDELDGISAKITDAQSSLVKVESEMRIAESLISRDKNMIERLKAELLHIEENSKSANSETEYLAKAAKEVEEKAAALEQKISAMRDEIRQILSEKESVNKEIISIRIKISEINSEIDIKNMSRDRESREQTSRAEALKRLEAFITASREKIREYKLNIENKRIAIKEADGHIAVYNAQIKEMIAARSEADSSIMKLKEDTIKQNELVNSLKIELDRLQNRIEKVKTQTDEIINRLWDDYEIAPSAAISAKQEISDLPAAKKKLVQLKSEMKALGNINLDSVEEYKEVRERYTFLSEQINDMESSKKELLSLIKELTVEMTKQFAEKFEIINKNFAEVFTELFGGGSAALSLTDNENILESGIEIDVRPPGKKLQRLSLLSGGEMAFTAIALLFAILKVRATPFCILDEIEAALDDNNIDRFGQYVKKFSDKTQFIIVTHRRGTMAAADILYGVTMQEKGISKLLTMRLDDVETDKE